MANYSSSSLFTSAITGLNSNYLLLLNGNTGLTLNNILNPQTDSIKYSVNQTFRSYLMTNFNNIDLDGDGEISQTDLTNYNSKLQTQGMTYNELSSLCSTGGNTMSSLLDTVLSNFNEIDSNHDGRVTQSEINAYRVDKEIKKVKEKYPKIDPTKMSMFIETTSSTNSTSSSESDDDNVFNT